MKLSRPPLLLHLLLLLFLLPLITTTNRLNDELSLATSALQSHGYNFFPNALAESDSLLLLLRVHLLSSKNSTLTLFSPPDSLPFSPPDSFFHLVSPFRLTKLRLRTLSSGTCLKTLLPHDDDHHGHHILSIERKNILPNGTSGPITVAVDGMRLSVADLFVGPSIAVHALEEVLPIDQLAAPYISPWTETTLLRLNKNSTEIKLLKPRVDLNLENWPL